MMAFAAAVTAFVTAKVPTAKMTSAPVAPTVPRTSGCMFAEACEAQVGEAAVLKTCLRSSRGSLTAILIAEALLEA